MVVNNTGNTTGNIKTFYISLGILLFVVIGTLVLKIYNSLSLEKEIYRLESEKNQIVEKIENIKHDERVVLYSMIENNKSYLNKKQYLSKIDIFINTLKDLSNKYDIKFEGFSYSNGQIKTKAQSSTNNVKKSFEKIYSFIDFLRTSDDHIFTLNFINTFVGQDTIEFNTVFSLK